MYQEQFSGRSVFVTGASGFMGTWLTRRLVDAGAHVVTLLNHYAPDSLYVSSGLINRVTNIPGNLTDFAAIEKLIRDYRIDTVLHLAAVAIEGHVFADPLTGFEANIRGTYHILEACRRNADIVRRVVVASSDKAYGDSPILPYTEDMPLLGRNPYDCSKSCADLLAKSYHHSFGLPVAVGRFGNIYGGGDLNFSRLIPGSIRRIRVGESPMIKVPPQGEFMRDFLYVEDAVDSYLAMAVALDRKEVQGEAFNFAMGEHYTPSEVARELLVLMNKPDLPLNIVRQDHSEIFHQHVSSTKARTLIGWKPQHTFRQGLQKTLDWYLNYLNGASDTQPAGRTSAPTLPALRPSSPALRPSSPTLGA